MTAKTSTKILVTLILVATLAVAGHSQACPCGCDDGPVAITADIEQDFAGRFDFFTNYGQYMPRKHCLRTAEGTPDWPWITALIGLNAIVAVGYARIVWFWLACYWNEDSRDRDKKLLQLAWIFTLCATCGYGMSTLIFFWPAYRLLAILLFALAIVTWRFALDLAPFQKAFTANRLQRELDHALHAEKVDLMGMLDATPVANILINNAGRIVMADCAATEMFGYSQEELVGRPIEDLLPERYRARHPVMRDGYFANPSVRFMGEGRELFGLHRLGHEVPIEIGLSPVELEEGVHALAVVIDITNRKASEKLMIAAREEAEAASRAKSDFLANMSHEIRTPMNAIMGLTEIVLTSDLNDLQRECLSTVSGSAESLLQVINDILDFSKIEAGKLELDETSFQIRDLVGDVLKSLGLRSNSTGLEITYSVAPQTPDVLIGDPGRLRQVLVNLVGNAIKFTEEGHVFVQIGLAGDTSPDADRVRLRVSVEDTGVGIEAEKIDKVFAEFEQADTSATRQYGGTGLGLAITSKLISAMGGEITVNSELGRGSTFAFTVELGVSDEQATQPWQEVVDRLRGARVLLVDDNKVNLRILEENLTTYGIDVTTASCADYALRMLELATDRDEPFSIVISDVHMPGVDGYDLAAIIRENLAFGNVPVALLTSTADSSEVQRIRDLKLAGRLLKPVKQSELLELMIRALGLADEVDAHRGLAMPIEPGAEDSAAAIAPLRILLAEDSIPNQKLALAVLSGGGHKTVVAGNGREAVEALQSQAFDLVLMDIQMPEMDGYQATAAIRDLEEKLGNRTPIIAVTAHALTGDREKCLAAGMDDYVSKPIRQDDLFAAVRRVTTKYAVAPSEETQGSIVEDTPPVPWEDLLAVVGGDRVALAEIVEAYAEELDEVSQIIADAIDQQEASRLQKSAHKLKSALRFFQVAKAVELAQQLEDSGASGDLSLAAERWRLVGEAVKSLRPQLDEFLREECLAPA